MNKWDSDRFARDLKEALIEQGMPSMDLRVRFYLDGWVGVWIYNCEGTNFTLHRGYPHGMTHDMDEFVDDILGAYQTRDSTRQVEKARISKPSAE